MAKRSIGCMTDNQIRRHVAGLQKELKDGTITKETKAYIRKRLKWWRSQYKGLFNG